MAAINTLSHKAVEAAIKAAAERGKPATVNDGGGLSMIARPDGAVGGAFDIGSTAARTA